MFSNTRFFPELLLTGTYSQLMLYTLRPFPNLDLNLIWLIMNFYNVVAISINVIVIVKFICLLVIFHFILVYSNLSFTE